MLRKIFAVLLITAFVGVAQPPAPAPPPFDGFDAFVDQTLKDWKCAGMAIGVVQNGHLIWAKGYGLRDVDKKKPVSLKTLFAIGSATKSFTVTSLGVLADRGQLDWDKPVREYMPDFRMMDPFASERMTARDLVTHRSGLPRHDMMWYNSPFSRQEIFDRLQYLEPNKDFRSTFQYQNLMVMTAGMLGAHIAGTSWEDLVRKEILRPLGMQGTNFSVTDSQKSADYSLPYTVVKDQITEMGFRNIDAIGPAGSINSNVEDMTRYLIMHMQHGKPILSERISREMQSPQMSISGPPPDMKELGAQSYGMGFFLTTYRGHYLVHHGGNIDGFSALVTFMPQDGWGMVILTNQNGSTVPTVVSYNVYDRLLGMDQIEWTRRLKEQRAKAAARGEEAKKKGYTIQRTGTHPSHDLSEYAGEYESPAYGIAKVEMENGALKFSYHGMGGPLNHFHYDVFEVAERDLEPLSKEKVEFHSNLQGDIDSLAIPLEASVKEIVFTRRGDAGMREKTFLEPLTGVYRSPGGDMTVAMKGDDTITLTVPGQPVYELVPMRGTRFNIKGLIGYTVEFKGDELVVYQPNTTFSATRKK